ncbi:MAG: TonB-dependent receptor, partial [Saprospiraceae bacterium]
GKGTTGSDYDLSISSAGWGRDLHFKTQNIAVFAENKFQLTRRFSVSPGMRIESGESKVTGSISYLPPLEVQNKIEHRFPLFGVNAEYELGHGQNLYAGWSQAYRPVVFKDIIPANFYERADKDLQDAYGNTAEIGWRGNNRSLKWDVTAFSMLYNHRLGAIAQYEGALDTFVLLRTNIGDSRTNGLELFVEYRCHLSEEVTASIFSSTAYFDARYLGDSVRVNKEHNASIKGNRVESVPEWISRNGVNVRYKGLSVSVLYSYTAASYANPLNTVVPSADGAVGLVPDYGLLDLNATFRTSRHLTFRFNLNNLTNTQYFTKRPAFYPGPGLWPSDGRSVNVSVGLNF